MKLKKIFIVIIAMMVCLSPLYVVADNGGTGGQIGGSGGSSSGGGSNYFELGPGYEAYAYKFRLVYKPKNGSLEYLGKCVVAQNVGKIKSSIRNATIRKVKEYANRAGCNYKDSGNSNSLVAYAGRLGDGGDTTQMFPNGQKSKEMIKQYVQELGVPYSQMTREQYPTANDDNINSYGYRVLVEKVILWGKGNNINDVSGRISEGIAMTRREFSKTNNLIRFSAGGKSQSNLCGYGMGCTRELYTRKNTIGIRKSNALERENNGAWVDKNITSVPGTYTNDSGHGYNILWLDTASVFNNYDYDIDAACVGCDVKGLDNRAMIIQDTTDWEAIMNSRTQTLVKSAQNYYYDSDSGSYCREEYRVKLPDSSKEITVKPGKYLTVGALKKELEKLTKGTANVGPIEVTKIIQCKGGDLNKRRTVNEQRYFINKNGSKSKSLGTIKLQYEECGDNRKYNGDIDLVPNFKEGFPSVNSSISVDDGKEMLTQSQTVSYTLPSNTYRYVRNQDGLSIKSLSSIKANDLNTKYRDLGFSTLPISFDNEGDSVKVKANLHFEYTLPEHGDGAYSAIKKAYGTKNYFKSSGNAVDNVYKKYTKGDAKAKTQINKSACNKLYGTTNQACINSHVNDKTADCKNINKISSDKTGSCEKAYSQNGYVCPVKIPPIPACPPGECPPEDPPCENGRPRCADGTCPVDGEECKPCEDDLCTDVPGIDVIYRPIDLANPFPGQKGSKTKSRKTGANWCEYNQKTGKLNCSANNAVSKKYIINKKVYNDNHVLYKVTLDANTISKVRNYNKNKKYDDFDLKCKDGKACISDFLNNVINVEGKCSKVNHGNFYTCNK